MTDRELYPKHELDKVREQLRRGQVIGGFVLVGIFRPRMRKPLGCEQLSVYFVRELAGGQLCSLVDWAVS